MKAIQSIFFFAFLIHAILGSEDLYVITVQDTGAYLYGCENNGLYFYIDVKTSGFTSVNKFELLLKDPFYMKANCEIPPSIDGETQQISCVVNLFTYPLITVKTIVLPDYLRFEGVVVENWEKALVNSLELSNYCVPEYSIGFLKEEKGFSWSYDEKGQKILKGYGSLIYPLASLNDLNEEYTLYNIQPNIYADSQLTYADCNIYDYNTNSGDVEIHCAVLADKEVILFPTLIKDAQQNIWLFNVNENIYLSGNILSSSYLKLFGLLLLLLLF